MMFQRDLVSIRTSHCTWQRCVLGVMFVSALLQIAFASNAARLTDFLPASRAVDDITPAVKNATAEAIAEAENILNSYSDILIGLAIRKYNSAEIVTEILRRALAEPLTA